MTVSARLAHFFQRLQDLDKRIVFLLACALLFLIFGIDLAIPPMLPLGPYYLLPIALAAWCLGGGATIFFIVMSSLARTYGLSGLFPSYAVAYFASDMVLSILIYSLVAFLVIRLGWAYRLLAQHADSLETQVRHARQRERLESSIRRAVPSDVDAIVELAAFGAQDGDFSKDVTTAVRQEALRTAYMDNIRQGNGPRATWFGERAVVPIELWVVDINGKIAGFFMVMGLDSKQGTERELHAIATSKEYQGLGVGTAMVDFFCSHYYGRRLYVACMPNSRMREMLKRRGFYHFADSKEGYVIVERVEWPKEKGLLKNDSTEACEATLALKTDT